jgi:hypothetical protein
MDKEQLKMVLDALQSLGAEGKDAFIWWLVMDKTIAPVAWLVTLCVLALIVRWIIRASTNKSRLNELRALVGVSEYDKKDENYGETISRAIDIIRRQRAG